MGYSERRNDLSVKVISWLFEDTFASQEGLRYFQLVTNLL
jgi:hypothetical protein